MSEATAKVIEVIQVETTRGSGEHESDPCRTIFRYFAMTGEFIAEYDPFVGETLRNGDTK